MKTLNGTGQMVVAGRLGTVGIRGFITRGGVNFSNGQYGLAADMSYSLCRFDQHDTLT